MADQETNASQPPHPADDDLAGQQAGPADADAELALRLKEAREARQLTQQAVATRSKWADIEGKGISRTALVGYEAGTSRPGARELRILCRTLVVSPNKLLFGTETPIATAHPALETIGSDHKNGLRQAVDLAFVLAALKGHERDALASLALSMAGRQLGDLRLSYLRMLAAYAIPAIVEALKPDLPDGVDPSSMSLEDAVDALTRGAGSNLGTNLKLDGDQVVGGEWLYQDPKHQTGNVEKDDI